MNGSTRIPAKELQKAGAKNSETTPENSSKPKLRILRLFAKIYENCELVINNLFKGNDLRSVVILTLHLNMAVHESDEMPKTTSELLGTTLNSLSSKLADRV